MQLTVWTYEGPPHIGAMRIAASMRGVHLVLHAPQGDTYADLLFTMVERGATRPPVSYTTFQARDLGSDSASLLQNAVRDSYERFTPELLLVGASCTAELLQDDPGGIARALNLPVPVLSLDLPAYQRKENWGAAETLYAVTRAACKSVAPGGNATKADRRPRCNVIGPTSLGFHHRDDLEEVLSLLQCLTVDVNVVAPLNATFSDLKRLPDADFNVLLYPEVGRTTVEWLHRQYGQPYTRTIPIGLQATRDFINEVATLASVSPAAALTQSGNLAWYSHSVDSTYLTGKRVYLFGDATHVLAAARVAKEELGFSVVGMGTYSREQARDVRAAAGLYGVEPLITDDYLSVESEITRLQPELVLGTQMERHIAKRLGIPCAVISAPAHVQDFPARYTPQMGYEGANVLFDTWVQPLMMGLEEHLLGMFREDFEFHPAAPPSHLGVVSTGNDRQAAPVADAVQIAWAPEAERELGKVPFFVRARARRNTEDFARQRRLPEITVDTLYEAKSHFAR